MKKEYVNPSMLLIDISADIDTVTVSDTGDGPTEDLGEIIQG